MKESAKRRVIVLAPALVLALVAVVHLGCVWAFGASRWRVGGMGMYSEYHPNDREIVFDKEWREVRGREFISDCAHGDDLRRRATTHPTRTNIEAFAEACAPEVLDGWRARVIHPVLDAETLEFETHVVRELDL